MHILEDLSKCAPKFTQITIEHFNPHLEGMRHDASVNKNKGLLLVCGKAVILTILSVSLAVIIWYFLPESQDC